MKIILVRHGKVDMNWEKKYTAKEFDAAWAEYETRPIFPIEEHYEIPEGAMVFTTPLQRTQDTARQFLGVEDFTVIDSGLANEVPLKAYSYKKEHRRHRRHLMNVIGRLQWYLPRSIQDEQRRESYERAMKLIDFLESQPTNACVVVMHGFMIRTVGRALSDRGYKVKNKRNFAVPNLCVVEASKD